MVANTIRELIGADKATAYIGFSNGEKIRFSDVVEISSEENLLTLCKKDLENITINKNNMNYISFATAKETEQEAADMKTEQRKNEWLKKEGIQQLKETHEKNKKKGGGIICF